jgi:hypothetical protein
MSNDSQATEKVANAASSQGGQTEQETNQSALGNQSNEQTSNKGQSAKERDNIRALQSSYDRRIAEMSRTIQSLQGQLYQMEEKSAPDDYSKLELRLRREQEARMALEQEYTRMQSEQQAEAARMAALNEIMDEFGVPLDAIRDAEDYKDAVKRAVKYQKEQEKAKAAEKEGRVERNRPDLGASAPEGKLTEWEEKRREAIKNRDSVALMKLAGM